MVELLLLEQQDNDELPLVEQQEQQVVALGHPQQEQLLQLLQEVLLQRLFQELPLLLYELVVVMAVVVGEVALDDVSPGW
jgi:hypothetical protein